MSKTTENINQIANEEFAARIAEDREEQAREIRAARGEDEDTERGWPGEWQRY